MTAADRLRALADKATPGPWLVHEHNQVWVHHDTDPTQPPATKVSQAIFGDDARLIALAPVAVREWAACLDALAKVGEYDDAVADWDACDSREDPRGKAELSDRASELLTQAIDAARSALARAEQHTKEATQ